VYLRDVGEEMVCDLFECRPTVPVLWKNCAKSS